MQKNSFLENIKKYLKIALLEIIVILAVVIVDLIVKFIMARAIGEGNSVTVIPKFLHFTYSKNYAAAFSFDFGLSKAFGELGRRIMFIIITFLALGLFSYMLISAKGGSKVYRVSLALIIGGAIGNLYDRIFYGYVRDFIEIEYFGEELFGAKTFAIFNIADSALVIGTLLLVVYFIFFYKEPAPQVQPINTDDNQPKNDENYSMSIIDCRQNLCNNEENADNNGQSAGTN